MKTIAYLRISTRTQELDSQRLAILNFAHQEGFQVDQFIQATISSRKSLEARKINVLLEELQEGDCLIVAELSRLGRSVGEIVRLVDQLVKKQVRFFAIKEGIRLNGKQELQTKVTITLFSLMAEIERDLISERTKEGIAAARAKGKKPGRPKGKLGRSKLDGREKEIKEFLEKGVSKTSLARIVGCSKTALIHFVKTRGLVK
jgi:DNA invertase Pin-like site-specific DNA recombinase